MMGKNIHYSIIDFFENRMAQHSNVASCRPLKNDTEYVYEIKRLRFGDTVRVWLSDHYHFNEMDLYNRPREIRAGDYILIARPEAQDHGGYSEDNIRVGKLADFMGSLNKKEMWKYEPPSDDEKKERARNRSK